MRIARLSVVAVLVFTILMGGLFAGCGGGGADIRQSSNTTTLGQQLVDLQAAYEKGIITQREYEKAKKNLLKQYK